MDLVGSQSQTNRGMGLVLYFSIYLFLLFVLDCKIYEEDSFFVFFVIISRQKLISCFEKLAQVCWIADSGFSIYSCSRRSNLCYVYTHFRLAENIVR